MAQTITKEFIVKVIGDGLKEVATEMRNLNTVTKGTAAASEKLQTVSTKTNRALQGVAGNTSNATKGFAKMQHGMSGLVSVYAPLAANMFALSAAFLALRSSADFAILTQSVREYGIQTGTSLSRTAEDVRSLTKNLVSLEDSMRQVTIASAAGFDTKTIKDLTNVATNASFALGRDLSDSLERVFRGAIKAEPELLDELGIILRLEPATKKYAAQLGKTVAQLSTFEKQQAVVNEVIQQGNDKFSAVSEAININGFSQLAAIFVTLAKEGGNLLNTVLGPIASFFANNTSALTAVVVLFTGMVLKQAIPAMKEFSTTIQKGLTASLSKAAAATANYKAGMGKLTEATKKFKDVHNKQFLDVNKDLEKYLDRAEKAGKKGGITKNLLDSKNIKKNTTEYYTKLDKSLTTVINRLNNNLPVIGYKAEDIIPLKNIQDQAIRAGAALTAGIKTVEKVTVSSFDRMGLRITGAFSIAGAAYTKFFSAATDNLLRSASLVYEKGIRVGISEAWRVAGVAESKYFASVSKNTILQNLLLNKTGFIFNTISLAYKRMSVVVGGLGAFLVKSIPFIGQIVIAWELLTSVLSTVSDLVGLTTKESRAMDDALSSAKDTLLEIAESTSYYNRELASLAPTIDNQNKQLDHQIGRLGSLANILDDLQNKASAANNPLRGMVSWLGSISPIKFGNLENFKSSLASIAVQLKAQGLGAQILELKRSLGEINAISSEKGALEYAAGLTLIGEKSTKARKATKTLNVELMESIKTLSTTFEAVTGGLPKLDAFEKAALAASNALTKINGRPLQQVASLFTNISDIGLINMGISPTDVQNATSIGVQLEKAQNEYTKLRDASREGLSRKAYGQLVDDTNSAVLNVQILKKLLVETASGFVSQMETASKGFAGLRKVQTALSADLKANNAEIARSTTTDSEKVSLLVKQKTLVESLSQSKLKQSRESLTLARAEAASDKKANSIAIFIKQIEQEISSEKEKQLAIDTKITAITDDKYNKKAQTLALTTREKLIEAAILENNTNILTSYDKAVEKQQILLAIQMNRATLDAASIEAMDAYTKATNEATAASDRLNNAKAVRKIREQLAKPSAGTQGVTEKALFDLRAKYEVASSDLSLGLEIAGSNMKIDIYNGLLKTKAELDAKYESDKATIIQRNFDKTYKSLQGKLAEFRLKGTTPEQAQLNTVRSQFISGQKAATLAIEDSPEIEGKAKIIALMLQMEEDYQARVAEIKRKATVRQAAEMLSAFASVGSAVMGLLNQQNQLSVEATDKQYAKQVVVAKKGLETETIALRAQVATGLLTRKEAVSKLTVLEAQKAQELGRIEKARVVEQNKANKQSFENNKNLAMGLATINAIGAVVLQLNSGDGVTAFARAAAAGIIGFAQVAKIASTQFTGGTPVASISPVSGIPTGLGSEASTTAEASAKGGGITKITVLGKKGIVYSADTMEELLDEIALAVDRGDRILINKDSRNAQDIRGEI